MVLFQRENEDCKSYTSFKSGDTPLMTNYRPISILPCFLKKLERITYNRLYINISLKTIYYTVTNEFTLGVFVDWSKAFDTVDHKTLLKKIERYGIAGNNLRWFENYLKDRQHFISFEHNSTKKASVTCGVPQGSILGPLLFLLYVDDLHHASKILNPIMFADDTNLFFSHSDINVLFKKRTDECK